MSDSRAYDVIIVGAGVIGLAQALQAAKRGLRVAIFERSPRAEGASVRNFGMIWPIGQPAGPRYEIARRSRDTWRQLAEDAGFWCEPCGAIVLIHADDERAVACEFLESSFGRRVECEWLEPEEVRRRSPAAAGDSLQGGLYTPHELGVDPVEAIERIPIWLSQAFSVRLYFATPIARVEERSVVTAAGERFEAETIVVCGGDETRTLFPELLTQWDVYRCKLQMMRTAIQPEAWRLGPHLAGGLTLQHYEAFRDCPSLLQLRERIAQQTPELNRFGIHVMAAQNGSGEVILGDSHQYRDDVTPFDSDEIERLMLRELRRLIELPDWRLSARWHGIYAKHATRSYLHETPFAGVHVLLLPGGAGMTMSHGVAAEMWENQMTLTEWKA